MRAFTKGMTFTHVESEGFVPDEDMIQEMLADIERDGLYPTFSEGYLYPRVGKDDARFILGIAQEYEALIEVLGHDTIKRLLELPEGGRAEVEVHDVTGVTRKRFSEADKRERLADEVERGEHRD